MCLFCASLCLTDNTFEVKLQKGATGLGMSVEGGLDPAGGQDSARCILRVKEVFPGGAAAETKNIEKGDILLAVNGKSLKNLSHNVSHG